MRLNNFFNVALLIMLLVGTHLNAFAPTNFFPPYDPNLRLAHAPKTSPFRAGVNVEWGKGKHARNWDGKKRNVFSVYDDDLSTIAMLEQPAPAIEALPEFIAVRDTLRIFGARDDGIRGHVSLNGEFEQFDVTPHVQYVLPFYRYGRFALQLALPIRHARIHATSFADETLDLGAFDTKTKELLTNSFATLSSFVKNVGKLNLDNWSHTGLGDFAFTIEWSQDYAQDRDGLENVELYAFVGFTAPTGLEKDEDYAFSMAFGHDGAWSLPFGIGLDLDFKYHIALGASAQFEATFDHTKVRRIKTHQNQTDFLLLNKDRATKEFGLLWKFYLYMQAYHFCRGLSFKTAYEYVKHDDDSITPKSDDFNASVANSARSLEEWNSHSIIFQLNYDTFYECKNFWLQPQISFFYKLPVYGKSVLNPPTIGGQVAINF